MDRRYFTATSNVPDDENISRIVVVVSCELKRCGKVKGGRVW